MIKTDCFIRFSFCLVHQARFLIFMAACCWFYVAMQANSQHSLLLLPTLVQSHFIPTMQQLSHESGVNAQTLRSASIQTQAMTSTTNVNYPRIIKTSKTDIYKPKVYQATVLTTHQEPADAYETEALSNDHWREVVHAGYYALVSNNTWSFGAFGPWNED